MLRAEERRDRLAVVDGIADGDVLLRVRELHKTYQSRLRTRRRSDGVQAVAGVSLDIRKGETLGLVGESGCGKTTLGRLVLGLDRPTSGSIEFCGHELTQMDARSLRRLRTDMQLIFQDPFASLNPRMTAAQIIGEPLFVNRIGDSRRRITAVFEMLDRVGLGRRAASRYPHEFSGGQRQRIGIARALVLKPSFVVCDEAISALDVSIQAQILNLLSDFRREFGFTFLFISHDLGAVRHLADRIAVMYLGKIVETADVEPLFERPLHPYSKSLLAAVPIADPDIERTRRRIVLEGDLPSASRPPSGCRFRTRCPHAQEVCREVQPVLEAAVLDAEQPSRTVACHFWLSLQGNDHGGRRISSAVAAPK